MSKKISNISDFDFGFSFADGTDASQLKTENQEFQATIEQLQKRLDALYQAITPLLDNLCKDPEKSSIYWPDRVEKINTYRQKLQAILEGR